MADKERAKVMAIWPLVKFNIFRKHGDPASSKEPDLYENIIVN